ncbi:diphosphomevalonate decarboxylase, partial [Staphylococcus epidermidis]|nr:diphosphomevalonate decarboxylase [Staphylococcus epidermidis]
CRESGIPAYFTMDAGPNVKVLVQKKDQQAVIDKLTSYFDPEQIIASNIGTGVEILNEEDAL